LLPSATKEKPFEKPERPVRVSLKNLFQNFLHAIAFSRNDEKLLGKYNHSGNYQPNRKNKIALKIFERVQRKLFIKSFLWSPKARYEFRQLI
jgi:hypothetical protein